MTSFPYLAPKPAAYLPAGWGGTFCKIPPDKWGHSLPIQPLSLSHTHISHSPLLFLDGATFCSSLR